LTSANNIGYMSSIVLSKGHGMNFGAIGNNLGNTLDAFFKKPLGTPRSPHLLPKENFGPLVCML
jgi:hypothetical protein